MIDTLVNQAKQDGIQKFVVGAYILQEGKMLLLRRSETEDFLPGIVELPSGGVDEGETLDAALHREVLEETGLAIKSLDKYVNAFDYVSGSGKKARQFNFVVTIADYNQLKLNPQEHDAYYWVAPTQDNFKDYKISEKTLACLKDAVGKL